MQSVRPDRYLSTPKPVLEFLEPRQLLAAVTSLVDTNIGSPAYLGTAAYDATTKAWTVTGGGSDIAGSSDQFNFASQGVSGDVALVARVTSVGSASPAAKAGVMVRDGASASAPFAAIYLTASKSLMFQYRTSTGAAATSVVLPGIAAPIWVKILRSGNGFSAYYSATGTTWAQLGTTQTIAMSSSVQAGLAVTARDNAQLNSSKFTNVVFAPTVLAVAANPSPVVVGSSVTLSAMGQELDGESTLSYSWKTLGTPPAPVSFSANGSNLAKTTSVTLSAAGTYTFQVTITNAQGQIALSTLSVKAGQLPTVATAAAAKPVTVTSTQLSVLGADVTGESKLTYTWSTLGTPPASVSFADNNTNTAKTTIATFTKAGTYQFQVTIRNAIGLSTTSAVTVDVNQTLSEIRVTPNTLAMANGTSYPFAATAFDQFGTTMTTQPSFTWSLVASQAGGSISTSGIYTTPSTTTGSQTVRATAGSVFGSATITVTTQRQDLAKFQTAAADSAASNTTASMATDGFVNNSSSWISSGTGPHWLSITLPAAELLGSAQLYLGSDDTLPVSNFSLQYYTGSSWQTIPGTSFTGNTATVLNVLFTMPVTASQVRLYSTDATVRVREIALFASNGSSAYPIGTDVSLNLADQRPVIATSAAGTNYAINAADGYVGSDSTAWKTNTTGSNTLEVDLATATRVGSVHLYSGSASASAIANFRLQYWTGSAWADIPGGTVSGNTQKDLAIQFTSPVSTTKILLVLPDTGTQVVRELAVFAASTGITSYPLGTAVSQTDPAADQWMTYQDNYWTLTNRSDSGVLTSSSSDLSDQTFSSSNQYQQYQILFDQDSNTFRIRNRVTGLSLAASGTGVIETTYHGAPDELWRLDSCGNGYYQITNIGTGLVLQSSGQLPGTLSLVARSTDPRQQWKTNSAALFPKKGVADYGTNATTVLNGYWNYNWSKTPPTYQATQVPFYPMQWNAVGTDTLPTNYAAWHTRYNPVTLLGFNEPDMTGDVGGSNMSVQDALAAWPTLMAMNLPLLSPATATPYDGWLGDFYTQATALGYHFDYTGVHWYGWPSASGLISVLQYAYNITNRPVMLTEFNNIDWSGNGTWSEEDAYKFLGEFMWRAEDLSWLKSYSIFPEVGSEQANPWTHAGAPSVTTKSDGTLSAFGELYASWDGDRTFHTDTPYLLHNEGSSFRIGNTGSLAIGNIRNSTADYQWTFVSTGTAGHYYIVSARDGSRLWSDGTTIKLVSGTTTGTAVEWTVSTPDSSGYYFINHVGSGKRLRLNRTNDSVGAPVSYGLAMDSATAANDNTRWRFIKPVSPALPAGWTGQNVGAPAYTGSVNYNASASTWTVKGGGSDIWGTSDQFYGVTTTLTGDGSAIAQVTSIGATDPWAKAGVMFRSDSSASCVYAAVVATPTSGINFQWRSTVGGSSSSTTVAGIATPIWVKLTRIGNSFSAYYSNNGTTWTQVGTAHTLSVATTAQVGLAVTSHNSSLLTTGVFANVSVLANTSSQTLLKTKARSLLS